MKTNNLIKNPYLLFSPFLIIYLTIALVFHHDGYIGDENRYMILAEHLLKLNLSPFPYVNMLTNGPGYPIVLLPFVAFHIPVISINIMNAFMYYFSIILIFKSLCHIANLKVSIAASLFWACYYNLYESIPFILTEMFTVFLISVLIFSLTRAFHLADSKKVRFFVFLSGFTLGYIALTKLIFGYVLLLMLSGSIILWLSNRKSDNYYKGMVIVLIAIAINIPYLVYTYHQTGKIFKWGGVAGDNMYWMSTPYKGEYGNWFNFDDLNKKGPLVLNHIDSLKTASIISNHYDVYSKFPKNNVAQKDELLVKITINNIISHPLKYLQNCISNMGRILFNFPYSYTLQSPVTLLRLPLNGIICVFLLYSLIPTIINWRKINYPIRFLLLFTLIYLGGSIFVNAETRVFTMIVPILLLWIAYTLQNTMKINLKFKENQ